MWNYLTFPDNFRTFFKNVPRKFRENSKFNFSSFSFQVAISFSYLPKVAFFVYFSRQIGTFPSILTLFASFDKQHRKNCEKLSANCFRLKRICDHEEVACKCQLLDLVMLPSHRLFKPEIGGSMAQKNAIFAHSPKESF